MCIFETFDSQRKAAGVSGSQFLDTHLTPQNSRCGQFFDAATGSGTELENLDALMGKAKVLEGKRQWAQALDCLNKARKRWAFGVCGWVGRVNYLVGYGSCIWHTWHIDSRHIKHISPEGSGWECPSVDIRHETCQQSLLEV